MVFGNSQTTQVRFFRDIDTILVGQDTPFVCPINQFRLEWQRHIRFDGRQSHDYNEVRVGGGGNLPRERGVNEVNK